MVHLFFFFFFFFHGLGKISPDEGKEEERRRRRGGGEKKTKEQQRHFFVVVIFNRSACYENERKKIDVPVSTRDSAAFDGSFFFVFFVERKREGFGKGRNAKVETNAQSQTTGKNGRARVLDRERVSRENERGREEEDV